MEKEITKDWLNEYGFKEANGKYLLKIKNDFYSTCFIEVMSGGKGFFANYSVNGAWASENLHTPGQIIKLHQALEGK